MSDFIFHVIDFLSSLLLLAIGCMGLVIIYLYFVDVHQHQHAIRRNYPVIGRFRYFFERQGKFFRQYFFALDREEMPFNRAERSWVYQAAKNQDRTSAFGSTQSLDPTGTILFMNCAFPTLDEDALEPEHVLIGEYSRCPYHAKAVFNISGMSYGSLSKRAVQALSRGAKLAGCWINTGEGGLSPYHLEGGADIVFQIGTAKYGVRDEQGRLCDEKLLAVASHEQVKMFEIKLSQGAKPGKGGILPGCKVTAEIASIRGIPEGLDSISPNRHPEIKSAADLLAMVNHIRSLTGKPTGFKAVIGETGWLEELMGEIHQRGKESAPDFITIDGADGGTGAAPQPLMDSVGLPLKESLPWLVNLLERHGLRERIRIIASGKLIVPSRVAWAIALGADFVVSARGHMFALGCIQAMQCNKNTCPTGVTTHHPKLMQGLDVADKTQRVANYNRYIHYGIGLIAHSCGVKNIRSLNRGHVRVVQEDGLSQTLDEMYAHYK
ncbi:FMN-binding glutamate synthase family protein [Photobacterium sp. CCB-ST2H9]|uniref:FMN-binding glutamate synthase family protein n=1 Tax=Photobacterium sp. CCB-ST2H9 TaxID=2912855 RepID=UPI002004D459|nr:FMN-binding glutamate synthase family protein [Photobacterium sp. CCB-ST2H9]UTM57841.1 FMN-binding glutamate synthase family protein [Photobacterium sp. CCB-ST2H9]